MTERDEATNLDHTTWRKNDSKAGRWTSPDPYKGSMNVGNPQSFNRYTYTNNDPVNYVDPSGLNASAGGGYRWSCWVTWHSDADGSNYQITSISCQTWSSGGGGNRSDGSGIILPSRERIDARLNANDGKCKKFIDSVLKKGGKDKFKEGGVSSVLDNSNIRFGTAKEVPLSSKHGLTVGKEILVSKPMGLDFKNLSNEQTEFYLTSRVGTILHEVFHRGFSDYENHGAVARAIMNVIPAGTDDSKALGLEDKKERRKIRGDDDKSSDLIDAALRHFCS